VGGNTAYVTADMTYFSWGPQQPLSRSAATCANVDPVKDAIKATGELPAPEAAKRDRGKISGVGFEKLSFQEQLERHMI
jgi:hypothetical protein